MYTRLLPISVIISETLVVYNMYVDLYLTLNWRGSSHVIQDESRGD